jgi:hypothetical protein
MNTKKKYASPVAMRTALEYPPVSWKIRFEKLVKECNMSENLDSAFSQVNQFYKTLWENND